MRSATALQKYKEIQNSNDPDYANQVLAHFGIKPKVAPTPSHGSYASKVRCSSTGDVLVGFSGKLTAALS